MTEFDNKILGFFDDAVLWVWNTFEIPRMSLLRAVTISWVVLSFSITALKGESLVGDAISSLLVFLALGFDEYNNARLSDQNFNGLKIATRERMISRIFRLIGSFIVLLMFFNYLLMFSLSAIPNMILDVLILAYINLFYSLKPMGPPVKKTKEVFTELAYAGNK